MLLLAQVDPIFAISAELVLVLLIAVLLALGAGAVGIWRVVGSSPRRNRAYERARHLLAAGDWQGAQKAVDEIRSVGALDPPWPGRVNNLEGECRRKAGDAALLSRQYEEALKLHAEAAQLLGLPAHEASATVVDGMLAELRQMIGEQNDENALRLASRILQLRTPCAEAAFWMGIACLRLNRNEQAGQAFRTAHEAGDRGGVEPTLYLGMHLLREGKSKESLRYLADANKSASNSVIVNWQLGMGLAVGGGDSGLAIRALQKCLALDGLPRLAKNPDSFWREAFPNGAYIPRLVEKHAYVCPILGSNVVGMMRQAKLALGQALFRAERTAEAAHAFQDLLNDSEPTPTLLRALGIALSKLERYDEAYPQLRAAYEQDANKSPVTACYLAHSAAKAKPSKPEDKPANVRWAVRLLVDVGLPMEAEPVRLAAGVYAEARALNIGVPVEDQLRLCDTLVALNAVDPVAAGAYDHLAATMWESVRPPYAFHFGRAVQLHGIRGEKEIELLDKVFRHGSMAQEYFEARGWSLAGVERAFLERWAERKQGFPDVFGPDYPAQCEKNLLETARAAEAAGDTESARSAIALLQRLIPAQAATYDRLAKIAWHRGELDEAIRLLKEWINQDANNVEPLIRLASIEHQRGDRAAAMERVKAAFDRSGSASDRARSAYLAARLALKDQQPLVAYHWLTECLAHQPQHAEALVMLAAMRWRDGDRAGVAALVHSLSPTADPRSAYLTALSRLEAGDPNGARDALQTVHTTPGWHVDASHLLGIIAMHARDWPTAGNHLAQSAAAEGSPPAEHSRALLGLVRFNQGQFIEAARWWRQVSPASQQTWKLTPVLADAAYLAGLQSLQAGDELSATEWLGKARELGLKEPRLNPLQERAAVLAARRILEVDPRGDIESLIPMLSQVTKNRGSLQLPATLLLARSHRRHQQLPEARDVLRRINPPPIDVLVELGLTALQDQQLSQADECFTRVLQEQPNSPAVRFNLFWLRLSLGQTTAALELTPELIREAGTTEDRRLLTHMQILLQGGSGAMSLLGDLTVEEERRLIASLFAVSKLDVTVPMMCILAGARSHSPSAREAQTMGMIRLGKQRFDRGDWLGCEKWLAPLAKARPIASVRNLLGCCLCLMQDFASGILHFQEALRLAGDDPRIHQNLALAFSWQGDLDEADLCWGRYLGTYDKRIPRPPGVFDYHDLLRFHILRHLGNQNYDRERWQQALAYLHEAHELRPDDLELAERVFLLQVQAGNRPAARSMLTHMQTLKPKHGPFELYELDLIEVQDGADLERLLDALAQTVERLIDDPTSQDKAVARVLPQLQARADGLTRVLREIRDDLHRLDDHSHGFYDALRDLRGVKRDMRRLRQITRYCASLQVNESQRRRLESMTDDLERKIDYCRRWEEID